MKKTVIMSEEELLSKATKILIENLGMVETTRLFSMFESGKKDSVKVHRKWQSGLNKDDFFNQLFTKK